MGHGQLGPQPLIGFGHHEPHFQRLKRLREHTRAGVTPDAFSAIWRFDRNSPERS